MRVTNTTRVGAACAVVGVRMRLMTSASLAVVSMLLCGCSLLEPNKPDAVDMGGGRYSVTGITVSSNIVSARHAAAVQASAFCGSSSRQAVIESFDDQAQGDARGERASSAIFYCK
jgi:hypothetical protein